MIPYLVGKRNMFYFSVYWEFHHPKWRTHIFQKGRYTTSQILITIHHIYWWLTILSHISHAFSITVWIYPRYWQNIINPTIVHRALQVLLQVYEAAAKEYAKSEQKDGTRDSGGGGSFPKKNRGTPRKMLKLYGNHWKTMETFWNNFWKHMEIYMEQHGKKQEKRCQLHPYG